MKIKDNKNLKYDEKPIDHFDGPEWLDPGKCILESVAVSGSSIEFYFQNGGRAVVKTKNPQGIQDLELVKVKLFDLVGKAYAEILEIEF
jgi:hypothetical protein